MRALGQPWMLSSLWLSVWEAQDYLLTVPLVEIPPVWSPQSSFFTVWSWQPAYTGPLGKTSDWSLLILWGPCQGTQAHRGLYPSLSAQQLWGSGREKFNFLPSQFYCWKNWSPKTMVALQRSYSEYLPRWGSYAGVKTEASALACELHLLKGPHLCHLTWHAARSLSVMSLSYLGDPWGEGSGCLHPGLSAGPGMEELDGRMDGWMDKL